MSKYDIVMLDTASLFANQSKCQRLKTGAVLTKDGRILATGYNGTISGKPNGCELSCPKCNSKGCDFCQGKGIITNEFVLHAEQNIITFCAKNGIPTDNTTLYITHSPCKTCAKLIVQSGIKRVVYIDQYRDSEGIDFLEECNIEVQQIK